ncbi:MAG: hypothetical protein KGJ43_05690, partial [Acidobacteriota bacterium]|nr:hypothetical protein [Acidobacteriota bacterium]
MALALGATLLVALVLLCDLLVAERREAFQRLRRALTLAGRGARGSQAAPFDPGRERRAETRARALLRSCVNEEEWAMYRELGFLRVVGAAVGAADRSGERGQAERPAGGPATGLAGLADGHGEPAPGRYAYLIYPHKPIVAYLPQSGAILGEYCVSFEGRSASEGPARLPDADDVLAKWMLLSADERALLEQANMHLPGRQIDPERVRR